jgi:hypothetical protein
MWGREELEAPKILEEYVDCGYQNYRRYLAVKAQMEKRMELAPTNNAAYQKILGAAAATYATRSENLKRNAQKMLEEEAEKLEAALTDAQAQRWERLRQTVDKGGNGTAAKLLADRVRKADWTEVERLFDEGDEWAKSVIAMTVDEPEGDVFDDSHMTYQRILRETTDERYQEKLEDLGARLQQVDIAKRDISKLNPLAHAKAQDDALQGVAGIHEHALSADPEDFTLYERHKAAQTIDKNWTRITASLPADWEAQAEAEAQAQANNSSV